MADLNLILRSYNSSAGQCELNFTNKYNLYTSIGKNQHWTTTQYENWRDELKSQK